MLTHPSLNFALIKSRLNRKYSRWFVKNFYQVRDDLIRIFLRSEMLLTAGCDILVT